MTFKKIGKSQKNKYYVGRTLGGGYYIDKEGRNSVWGQRFNISKEDAYYSVRKLNTGKYDYGLLGMSNLPIKKNIPLKKRIINRISEINRGDKKWMG
jgi:hypothetical protein